MDKKRAFINGGLVFFPIFFSVLFYAFIYSNKAVGARGDAGDGAFTFFFYMPSIQGLFDIMSNLVPLFQLASLAVLGYFTWLIIAKKDECRSDVPKTMALAFVVLVITSLSLLILPALFFVSLLIARSVQVESLSALFYTLMDQLFFIVPLSALMTARYILFYLFAILFPLSLFLCIFAHTRIYGKIMLEQTVIWTFISDVVLILLMIVSGAMGILDSVFPVPAIYASLIAAASIVIAPLILLRMIDSAERSLSVLFNSVARQVARPLK
ncbi:MAG: hypothetical protein JW724_06695 [Candidatus Altiarchaeota archaeon]|nr:hypothetical protein [Candidatus Altiarchaeota archaeon]